MQFGLTDDQEFFRETTARFLEDRVPVAELRARRDDPVGFRPDDWSGGADLGWTSLLVPEDLGGGSISGLGLVDLTLVAFEFGRHAAPGPLVDTNVVIDALVASRADHHLARVDGLLTGAATASWCVGEPPPHDRLGEVTLEVRVDGDEVVLDGKKRPVESAAQAEVLLVAGRTGAGSTQVLVPAGTAGVTIEPMQSVDLTRRFASVSFDGVRLPAEAVVGEVGAADAQVQRQLRIAAVLSSAETVGAMQHVFDMTVDWAFQRYSFGRPLASYQALKHRFADMKAWLEAAHAISDAAATAVAEDAANADELASAAKAFVGEYGAELVHDCVQMHGGIGVTFEHDLHLFVRRVTLDRALWGTPADHRQRLASIAEHRGEAA